MDGVCGGSHRRFGFPLLPLVAEALDLLPVLTEPLSFRLVDGLESPRTVPAPRRLIERRAHEVAHGGCHAAPADYALVRPDPRRPGFCVVPTVLERRGDVLLPLHRPADAANARARRSDRNRSGWS